MPSPIAHIYYAHEYAARHHRSDEPAFLRGTVFPDVRFLANIDRSVTHRLDVSLSEVEAEQDDWRAGVLLHCWVDVAWTAYFEQYGLGPEDHAFDGMRTALKIIEDEQLHRLLGPMNVIEMARGIAAENEGVEYGVDPAAILIWNKLVAQLLVSKDAKVARELLMSAMHIGPSVVRKLEERVLKLRNNDEWAARVKDCRHSVTEIF